MQIDREIERDRERETERDRDRERSVCVLYLDGQSMQERLHEAVVLHDERYRISQHLKSQEGNN